MNIYLILHLSFFLNEIGAFSLSNAYLDSLESFSYTEGF